MSELSSIEICDDGMTVIYVRIRS